MSHGLVHVWVKASIFSTPARPPVLGSTSDSESVFSSKTWGPFSLACSGARPSEMISGAAAASLGGAMVSRSSRRMRAEASGSKIGRTGRTRSCRSSSKFPAARPNQIRERPQGFLYPHRNAKTPRSGPHARWDGHMVVRSSTNADPTLRVEVEVIDRGRPTWFGRTRPMCVGDSALKDRDVGLGGLD